MTRCGSSSAKWAADVAGWVGDPWPDMPAGVADRAADVWEPLLMVADLAGGDWPQRAAEACTAFVTGARDDTASIGTRLLADLRDVFGDADALLTQTILDRLHALDESPWADWYGKPLNARDLAELLKPYGVKSRHSGSARTAARDTAARIWTMGPLPPPPGSETSATSETPLASNVADVSAVSAPRQACAVCGDPLDPVLAAPGDTTHPMCDPEGETVKLSSRPAIDSGPAPAPSRFSAGSACWSLTTCARASAGTGPHARPASRPCRS